MSLPPFAVTVVGSWPRPRWLLDARRRRADDLRALEDEAARQAIAAQVEAGVDLVSDGEQRRGDFTSFVAERLDGVEAMTMADLLDHVEDKAAFEALLSALDVPAFAIRNPTATGRLARRAPLAADEAAFARTCTDRPLKVCLPGPYLLSRTMWVEALSSAAYASRDELVDDIVRVLREELADLAAAGVACVQLDEPALSELVLAGKSATRTFMCGALAAAASPEQELELAVDVVNRVVEGSDGIEVALHVCRGNWSADESVLLAGGYAPLVPTLARMRVDRFVLEYATERAGPLEALAGLPAGAGLGLGAVNPRTAEVEPVEAIVARARAAADLLGAGRVQLNPDCGFATFAERPVATEASARAKLDTLVAAARVLRAG